MKARAAKKVSSPRATEFVLVDISNTFTKVALSSRTKLGRIHRIPTRDLTATALRELLGNHRARHAVVASVVPAKNAAIKKAFSIPICWVTHEAKLGVGIDYPNPESIGADRLANAAAACALHGTPAIVVDFGTAVTFDVISSTGDYVGGVIAPGLNALTDYLHHRTALLPLIDLKEPRHAIGRSTREAMLSGAVHGYRGLIAEIIRQVLHEIPGKKRPQIIATGGDAKLIAGRTKLFTSVEPQLTLNGLRLIGGLNFPV